MPTVTCISLVRRTLLVKDYYRDDLAEVSQVFSSFTAIGGSDWSGKAEQSKHLSVVDYNSFGMKQ